MDTVEDRGDPVGAVDPEGVGDPEAARDRGEVVSAAFDSAFRAGEQVAVLLGQSLIGRKKWEQE